MHDDTDIIGHITGSMIVDHDGKRIDRSSAEEELPEKIDIITSAVIYKTWSDPQMRDRIEELTQEIDEGKWSVSMDKETNVAKELHYYGALSAIVQWYVLIRELKGDVEPDYNSVFNTEPCVSTALGLVEDTSILRTGEMRLPTLHKEILGEEITPLRGHPRKEAVFVPSP